MTALTISAKVRAIAPEVQEKGYPLSSCITCGSCLEVCPQVNDKSKFVGAAIISQVRLFNMHPTGAMHAKERLSALMGPRRNSGLRECAKLREGLPEGYSAYRIDRRSEPRGVETGAARLAHWVNSSAKFPEGNECALPACLLP